MNLDSGRTGAKPEIPRDSGGGGGAFRTRPSQPEAAGSGPEKRRAHCSGHQRGDGKLLRTLKNELIYRRPWLDGESA
jgi:hypothetical protein